MWLKRQGQEEKHIGENVKENSAEYMKCENVYVLVIIYCFVFTLWIVCPHTPLQ